MKTLPFKPFKLLCINIFEMDENLEFYGDKLSTGVTETGFTTPENYFSELTNNLQAQVLTERLKTMVPKDGYIVPENYFEKLHSDILSKTVHVVKKTPQAKMVRLWHSSLLKYASAACFILLSAVGFYFYELQQPNKKINYSDLATEQLLYDIDEQVIIDHIQANDLQRTKPSVTDVALENYILNNYSQSEIASDL
jgi:hypothetical protein